MLIAINGRKQSGKDTIGKIIEYLTGESTVYPFDLKLDYSYRSNWQIKKFADKLKDIICLLISCTREQLENESFKSKELGEEWWYWYMKLDGGYSPIILDYLTTTKKELKSYEGLELIKPTPRFLLQFIGTNLFRNQLHPEIWVNSLMNDYISYADAISGTSKIKKLYPNWITTDVRFLNEVKAIKKKDGIIIRINRESAYNSTHSSETALDDYEDFDYTIDNNNCIDCLIEKVKEILKHEKII